MKPSRPILFVRARLVFPDFVIPGSLLVEGSRIVRIWPFVEPANVAAEIVDCGDDYLGPGFVDIHNHGALGVDFVDGDPDGIARALRFHQSQGVTSMLCSLITHTSAQYEKTIRNQVAACRKGCFPGNYAGIHIEGPYLNRLRKGMHNEEWLRDPNPEDYRKWIEWGEGWVKHFTAAPELKGAFQMFDWLRAKGVTASIGHCIVSHEQAVEVATLGTTHFVHVNNVIDWPVAARNSQGWVQVRGDNLGAFLSTQLFTGEIIGDGHHVPQELIRAILRCKGPDHIALVSDAGPYTGEPEGSYTVTGTAISVRPGKLCVIADGSNLASSISTLLDMVRNFSQWGYPLVDAWRMASLTPARIIGLNDRGILMAGKTADFVRLDSNLVLKEVWQGGERVAGPA